MRPHIVYDEFLGIAHVYTDPEVYAKVISEISEETDGKMGGYDFWDEEYLRAALDECDWKPVDAIHVHGGHRAAEVFSAETEAAFAGANANAREQGWSEIELLEDFDE